MKGASLDITILSFFLGVIFIRLQHWYISSGASTLVHQLQCICSGASALVQQRCWISSDAQALVH